MTTTNLEAVIALARHCEDAREIDVLQREVITSRSYEHIARFATQVPGASYSYLRNMVIDSADAKGILALAQHEMWHAKGDYLDEIEVLTRVAVHSGDTDLMCDLAEAIEGASHECSEALRDGVFASGNIASMDYFTSIVQSIDVSDLYYEVETAQGVREI